MTKHTKMPTKHPFPELSRRIEQLAALHGKIATFKNTEHLLQILCQSICTVMESQFCVIGMINRYKQTIEYIATHELNTKSVVEKLNATSIERVLSSRDVLNIDHYIAAPIVSDNQPYGYFYVANKLNSIAFDQLDTVTMRMIATEISFIYESSKFQDTIHLQKELIHQQSIKNKKTLSVLKNNEILLRQFTENITPIFWEVDPQSGKILYVSPSYEKIWERSTDSLYLNPKSWLDSVLSDDRDRVEKVIYDRLFQKGEAQVTVEFRIVKRNGATLEILNRGFSIKDENGIVTSTTGIAIDVTDLNKGKAIAKVIYEAQSLCERSADLDDAYFKVLRLICQTFKWAMGEIWMLNNNHQLFCKIQYSSNTVAIKDSKINLHQHVGVDLEFANTLTTQRTAKWLTDYNTANLQTALGIPIIFNNEIIGALTLFSTHKRFKDIKSLQALIMLSNLLGEYTHHERLGVLISDQNERDKLTGFINRRQLESNLDQMIQNHPKQQFSIFTFNIDNYNRIIDNLGYQTADRIIQIIAERLERSSLTKNIFHAKIGPNELASILIGEFDNAHLLDYINQMRALISKPVEINKTTITVTPSIGIVCYPKDAKNASALLRNLDIATNQAKMIASNSYSFYKQTEEIKATERFTIETDLKNAISQNHFINYYQPKVDLKTRKITGFEALLRWNHPEKGMLYPSAFLEIAEETGLIIPISELSMRAIFKDLASRKINLPISINLSIVQFRSQYDIVGYIKNLMAEYNIPANELEFEVTENITMTKELNALKILNQLKSLGCKISYDDFGSGYSSFNYLRYFIPNTIKIDKLFIDTIYEEPNLSIVKAIILLAHSFNSLTVAEGVENIAQIKTLIQLGCDQIQGYYFSRPIPIEDIITLINDGKKLDFNEN